MDYKTKEEFMILLNQELKYLKKEERDKVLTYYYNKITNDIDYGRSEEATLKSLPTPHDIATEQYEKHGVDYLNLRKKQMKRVDIFQKIINSLLLLIVVFAEIFILFYAVKSDIRIIKLGIDLLHYPNNLISFLTILFIFLTIIILIIYILDLFIILTLSILTKILNFKEEIQNKLLNFSINVFLEEKTKKKKPLLIVLLIFLFISLIFFITSYSSKGYIYRSINDKPLNEERIELKDVKDIDIKSKTMNINIYSTDEESYLIYQYEFKHEKSSSTNNGILSVEYNDSDTYDIFNLLKEPTQRLDIYLNKDDNNSLKINSESGDINIVDVNYQNIEITSLVKSHIVLSNTNVDKLKVNGNNLYLGLTKVNINDIDINTKSGQQIIENNSNIKKLVLNNLSSILSYKDSIINNLDLINNSSNGNILNCEIEEFKYISTTSTLNIKNSYLKKIDTELNTSNITMEDVFIEESTISKLNNNSYFVVDKYISSDINLTADSSYIFLYNLGKLDQNSNEKADKVNVDIKLAINSVGSISKTQIEDSNIKDAYITQSKGYLILKNTIIESSTITLNQTTGVEYDNIDGSLMTMYINNIEEYFRLNSDKNPSIVIDVKDIDAISYAYIVNKGYDLRINLEPKQ